MLTPLTYSQVFSRAWPIILANAAVPLLGLVDTAIIGNTGSAQDLGAIALGALIFNFVYWSFGFLRMGTTGFIAQAAGARNFLEVRLVLGRALVVAFALALSILLLKGLLGNIIFTLFQASSPVEAQALQYFTLRVWGAPATLATFALMGTLVGLGKSKHILCVQIVLNGLNALFDIYFAGILGMGVRGIALGTIIAEYITFIFAAFIVFSVLKKNVSKKEKFWAWKAIIDKAALIKMVRANGDIMIRTIFLIFAFAWFANESAKFGDTILAANHILLQFVSFSAFFLDGFAFVTESIVGTAIGAKSLLPFTLGVKRSSIMAAATALCLALIFLTGGNYFISLLTDIESVRETALQYLLPACLYILLSAGAFQLDGIFIGAVRTREMRNAAILSTLFFLFCSALLTTAYMNNGLWLAFILYVIGRGVTLLVFFPGIRADLIE